MQLKRNTRNKLYTLNKACGGQDILKKHLDLQEMLVATKVVLSLNSGMCFGYECTNPTGRHKRQQWPVVNAPLHPTLHLTAFWNGEEVPVDY